MTRASRAVVVATWCALAAHARAQDVDVVVAAEPGEHDAAWARRFAASLERGGRQTRQDVDALVIAETVRQGATDPSRLDGLAEVAALLGDARAEAAALHEGRALAKLSLALQIAEAHPDVPGAAAWNAEVQTAIAIVAAQAGMTALSADALVHAATLDGTRGVRAAEAPPDLVAQAADVARRVATGPIGAFEVTTDAPGARVLLDDVDQGFAPRLVRAAVGRHVLRVEAPGRATFGTMLDVFEGQAPPLHIALDDDPWVAGGHALVEATRSGDAPRVRDALAALVREGVRVHAVWRVHASDDGKRAVVLRCDARRCGLPWGVPEGELPARVAGEPDLAHAQLPAGTDAFLRDEWHRQRTPTTPGFWDGPWPWVLGGVLVAIAGTILVGVLAEGPPPPMRVIILH